MTWDEVAVTLGVEADSPPEVGRAARRAGLSGEFLAEALVRHGAEPDDAAMAVGGYIAQMREDQAELVSTLTHDLRSPLTGLLGLVVTLRRAELPKETAEEFLRRAEAACNRMERLIGDVAALAQLDSGRMRVRRDRVDPEQLFDEVTSTMDGDVATHVPDDMPAIHGDYSRLVQILTRLLDNAVRVSDGPPRLTLRQGEGAVEFVVEDSGPGITTEHQARVFERFYKIPGPDQKGRAGLGLAIARELTALIGGRLQLFSVPGQGSTFTVQIPTAG